MRPLFITMLCFLAATVLAEVACRRPFLPPQTGCAEHTTRCSPSGIPETCAPGGAWTPAPSAVPCTAIQGPVRRVCCLAPSYVEGRRPLHACVRQTTCLTE